MLGYIENKAAPERSSDSRKGQSKAPRRYDLNDAEQALYDTLHENLGLVASGELSSTKFERLGIDASLLEKKTYTAEDLGVEQLSVVGEDGVRRLTDETRAALKNALSSQVDVESTMKSVSRDDPFVLYWFDKTEGYSYALRIGNVGYSESNDTVTFKDPYLVIYLYVSSAYSSDGTLNTFETDTEKTQAAAATAENALNIVGEAEDLPDPEKIEYYKDWILAHVSYDFDSAALPQTHYGDPWQLIYVFDGNENTNVVCEGYAKAFKFLCDLTDFDSELIECYIMTGYLSSGHMWNVIRMEDGYLYLADLTSCDAGMLGYPDRLFLKGSVDGLDTGYSFRLGYNSITYTYDNESMLIFPSSYRKLCLCNYNEHDWDEGTVLIPATEESEGQILYTCRTDPDHTKTETLPALRRITAENTTVEGLEDRIYTGSEITQTLTVIMDGDVLAEGTDYRIIYDSNINVGTAHLTIEGIRNFCGSLEMDFLIDSDITLEEADAAVSTTEQGSLTNTVTLHATVFSDDPTVIWTSSDPEIASVDENGVVTGMSDPGVSEAVVCITASTSDGKTAQCTVTVQDPVKAFVPFLNLI